MKELKLLQEDLEKYAMSLKQVVERMPQQDSYLMKLSKDEEGKYFCTCYLCVLYSTEK